MKDTTGLAEFIKTIRIIERQKGRNLLPEEIKWVRDQMKSGVRFIEEDKSNPRVVSEPMPSSLIEQQKAQQAGGGPDSSAYVQDPGAMLWGAGIGKPPTRDSLSSFEMYGDRASWNTPVVDSGESGKAFRMDSIAGARMHVDSASDATVAVNKTYLQSVGQYDEGMFEGPGHQEPSNIELLAWAVAGGMTELSAGLLNSASNAVKGWGLLYSLMADVSNGLFYGENIGERILRNYSSYYRNPAIKWVTENWDDTGSLTAPVREAQQNYANKLAGVDGLRGTIARGTMGAIPIIATGILGVGVGGASLAMRGATIQAGASQGIQAMIRGAAQQTVLEKTATMLPFFSSAYGGYKWGLRQEIVNSNPDLAQFFDDPKIPQEQKDKKELEIWHTTNTYATLAATAEALTEVIPFFGRIHALNYLSSNPLLRRGAVSMWKHLGRSGIQLLGQFGVEIAQETMMGPLERASRIYTESIGMGMEEHNLIPKSGQVGWMLDYKNALSQGAEAVPTLVMLTAFGLPAGSASFVAATKFARAMGDIQAIKDLRQIVNNDLALYNHPDNKYDAEARQRILKETHEKINNILTHEPQETRDQFMLLFNYLAESEAPSLEYFENVSPSVDFIWRSLREMGYNNQEAAEQLRGLKTGNNLFEFYRKAKLFNYIWSVAETQIPNVAERVDMKWLRGVIDAVIEKENLEKAYFKLGSTPLNKLLRENLDWWPKPGVEEQVELDAKESPVEEPSVAKPAAEEPVPVFEGAVAKEIEGLAAEWWSLGEGDPRRKDIVKQLKEMLVISGIPKEQWSGIVEKLNEKYDYITHIDRAIGSVEKVISGVGMEYTNKVAAVTKLMEILTSQWRGESYFKSIKFREQMKRVADLVGQVAQDKRLSKMSPELKLAFNEMRQKMLQIARVSQEAEKVEADEAKYRNVVEEIKNSPEFKRLRQLQEKVNQLLKLGPEEGAKGIVEKFLQTWVDESPSQKPVEKEMKPELQTAPPSTEGPGEKPLAVKLPMDPAIKELRDAFDELEFPEGGGWAPGEVAEGTNWAPEMLSLNARVDWYEKLRDRIDRAVEMNPTDPRALVARMEVEAVLNRWGVGDLDLALEYLRLAKDALSSIPANRQSQYSGLVEQAEQRLMRHIKFGETVRAAGPSFALMKAWNMFMDYSAAMGFDIPVPGNFAFKNDFGDIMRLNVNLSRGRKVVSIMINGINQGKMTYGEMYGAIAKRIEEDIASGKRPNKNKSYSPDERHVFSQYAALLHNLGFKEPVSGQMAWKNDAGEIAQVVSINSDLSLVVKVSGKEPTVISASEIDKQYKKLQAQKAEIKPLPMWQMDDVQVVIGVTKVMTSNGWTPLPGDKSATLRFQHSKSSAPAILVKWEGSDYGIAKMEVTGAAGQTRNIYIDVVNEQAMSESVAKKRLAATLKTSNKTLSKIHEEQLAFRKQIAETGKASYENPITGSTVSVEVMRHPSVAGAKTAEEAAWGVKVTVGGIMQDMDIVPVSREAAEYLASYYLSYPHLSSGALQSSLLPKSGEWPNELTLAEKQRISNIVGQMMQYFKDPQLYKKEQGVGEEDKEMLRLIDPMRWRDEISFSGLLEADALNYIEAYQNMGLLDEALPQWQAERNKALRHLFVGDEAAEQVKKDLDAETVEGEEGAADIETLLMPEESTPAAPEKVAKKKGKKVEGRPLLAGQVRDYFRKYAMEQGFTEKKKGGHMVNSRGQIMMLLKYFTDGMVVKIPSEHKEVYLQILPNGEIKVAREVKTDQKGMSPGFASFGAKKNRVGMIPNLDRATLLSERAKNPTSIFVLVSDAYRKPFASLADLKNIVYLPLYRNLEKAREGADEGSWTDKELPIVGQALNLIFDNLKDSVGKVDIYFDGNSFEAAVKLLSHTAPKLARHIERRLNGLYIYDPAKEIEAMPTPREYVPTASRERGPLLGPRTDAVLPPLLRHMIESSKYMKEGVLSSNICLKRQMDWNVLAANLEKLYLLSSPASREQIAPSPGLDCFVEKIPCNGFARYIIERPYGVISVTLGQKNYIGIHYTPTDWVAPNLPHPTLYSLLTNDQMSLVRSVFEKSKTLSSLYSPSVKNLLQVLSLPVGFGKEPKKNLKTLLREHGLSAALIKDTWQPRGTQDNYIPMHGLFIYNEQSARNILAKYNIKVGGKDKLSLVDFLKLSMYQSFAPQHHTTTWTYAPPAGFADPGVEARWKKLWLDVLVGEKLQNVSTINRVTGIQETRPEIVGGPWPNPAGAIQELYNYEEWYTRQHPEMARVVPEGAEAYPYVSKPPTSVERGTAYRARKLLKFRSTERGEPTRIMQTQTQKWDLLASIVATNLDQLNLSSTALTTRRYDIGGLFLQVDGLLNAAGVQEYDKVRILSGVLNAMRGTETRKGVSLDRALDIITQYGSYAESIYQEDLVAARKEGPDKVLELEVQRLADRGLGSAFKNMTAAERSAISSARKALEFVQSGKLDAIFRLLEDVKRQQRYHEEGRAIHSNPGYALLFEKIADYIDASMVRLADASAKTAAKQAIQTGAGHKKAIEDRHILRYSYANLAQEEKQLLHEFNIDNATLLKATPTEIQYLLVTLKKTKRQFNKGLGGFLPKDVRVMPLADQILWMAHKRTHKVLATINAREVNASNQLANIEGAETMTDKDLGDSFYDNLNPQNLDNDDMLFLGCGPVPPRALVNKYREAREKFTKEAIGWVHDKVDAIQDVYYYGKNYIDKYRYYPVFKDPVDRNDLRLLTKDMNQAYVHVCRVLWDVFGGLTDEESYQAEDLLLAMEHVNRLSHSLLLDNHSDLTFEDWQARQLELEQKSSPKVLEAVARWVEADGEIRRTMIARGMMAEDAGWDGHIHLDVDKYADYTFAYVSPSLPRVMRRRMKPYLKHVKGLSDIRDSYSVEDENYHAIKGAIITSAGMHMHRVLLDMAIDEWYSKKLTRYDATSRLTPEQRALYFGVDANGKPRHWGSNGHVAKDPFGDGKNYVSRAFNPSDAIKWFEGYKENSAGEMVAEKHRMLLGRNKTYFIPVEKDIEMRTFNPQIGEEFRPFNKFFSWWKQAAIYSAFLPFNCNNLIGDAFMVWVQYPSALKGTVQGVRNAYKMIMKERMVGTTHDEELNQFIGDQDIVDAGFISTEIQPYLTRSMSPAQVLLSFPRRFSVFRESILRLAVASSLLKHWKQQVGPVMGFNTQQLEETSIQEMQRMMATMTEEQKGKINAASRHFLDKFGWIPTKGLEAYDALGKIARDMLIDYSAKSTYFNRVIRGFLMPFGTWYLEAPKTLGKALYRGKLGPFFRMYAPIIASTAFNAAVYSDEEKELPSWMRQRFHIILGRKRDGEIRVFSPQMPFDVLPAFSVLGIATSYIMRYKNKEMSADEAAKRILEDWLGSSARGARYLTNAMIQFVIGVASNKDNMGRAIVPPNADLPFMDQLPYWLSFLQQAMAPPLAFIARADASSDEFMAGPRNMPGKMILGAKQWLRIDRAVGIQTVRPYGWQEELDRIIDKSEREFNAWHQGFGNAWATYTGVRDAAWYNDLITKWVTRALNAQIPINQNDMANIFTSPTWNIFRVDHQLRVETDKAKRAELEQEMARWRVARAVFPLERLRHYQVLEVSKKILQLRQSGVDAPYEQYVKYHYDIDIQPPAPTGGVEK